MRWKRFRLYVWSRTGDFSKFFDTRAQAHAYLKRKQFIEKRKGLFTKALLYDYDYQHKTELPCLGWWDGNGKWWTEESYKVYRDQEFGIWFNKYWSKFK